MLRAVRERRAVVLKIEDRPVPRRAGDGQLAGEKGGIEEVSPHVSKCADRRSVVSIGRRATFVEQTNGLVRTPEAVDRLRLVRGLSWQDLPPGDCSGPEPFAKTHR